MAYSVRGKFQQQSRYSNRKYNQLLDLMRVQAEDTIEIERQVNKRLNKASKAGDLGLISDVAKFVTAATPTAIDDVVLKLTEGAILDKRRSDAIGGIDTSNVKFLKAAANNADMEVRDLTRQLTEGLQFKNAVKDAGITDALKVISKSENFAKVGDRLKKSFDDIDFKGQLFTGGNVQDLLSLVKEGTGELVKEYKEYFSDPGKYLKEVDKYQNPEKYRNNNALLMNMALSSLGKNNMFSIFPFLMGGNESDTETDSNPLSATNLNKKGS